MAKEPLRFKVAPHIVEDLGLNLYTSLPRVLVEFVANAYDADSTHASISLDKSEIDKARRVLKQEYQLEVAKAEEGEIVEPLETRALPPSHKIVVEDAGHGMSRGELNDKFLVAGRRRRLEEPEAEGRSPDKRRPLMGRKGLGKLAGFGVAKLVTVETRKKGEQHATRITLDFDELVKKRSAGEIDIEEKTLKSGAGFGAEGGTRIILSKLLYDPLKSRSTTIENEVAEHFAFIDPADFEIKLNDRRVKRVKRTLAYAWPKNDELEPHEFVEHVLPREGGGEIKFKYRIRFTGKEEALPAAQRGVRVYSSKRLAASPSLLGADTNMHGFRMTDYLDGVVHADFIDQETADYVATDRQSLRWESPLLTGLYEFLSEEMKKACAAYQKKRDEDAPKIVQNDRFTVKEIEKHEFSGKDKKLAFRFAAILEKSAKKGVKDDVYKNTLPGLLKGIGHGTILTAISALAKHPLPDVDAVTIELTRLTQDELDQFIQSVKARLKGIEALEKVVQHTNFRDSRNEKEVQKLFEGNPWMVDPTYSQFLAADVSLGTVFKNLAKELGIGTYAKKDGNKKEPDLVFLIGNLSLQRIVIVELKASNIELEAEHLNQLEYYMQMTEEWLEQKGYTGFQIYGHLIGTKAKPQSRKEGVVTLRRRIKEAGPDASWSVRDFLEVLRESKGAHAELLEIHSKT